MMKRITVLMLSTLMFSAGFAQQYRFVYIQTENKQPFSVQVNNVTISSSLSGYVLIPKLVDGSYTLNIAFPGNQWPRQTINISVRKDAGYILKDLGDKGWGLTNLHTSEVIASRKQVVQTSADFTIDDDPFTAQLSEVVNSPELRRKPVATAVVKTEVPKEPVIEKKVPEVKNPIKEVEPVAIETVKAVPQTEAVVITIPRQLYNVTTQAGREMIFVDNGDTIRIMIPAKQLLINTGVEKERPKPSEKFIEMELPNPNANSDTIVKVPVYSNVETKPAIQMINSDCKGNATDEDFIRLRRKMASGDNDNEMLSAAKKAFKAKCYSTAQLKNLSVLFLSDAGRFEFFSAAYPFVTDSGNFTSLQQQLTDPQYIERFQALIRK